MSAKTTALNKEREVRRKMQGICEGMQATDSRAVQVEFDSAIVGARDIIAAVKGMGYSASLLEPDNLSAGMEVRERERRMWRRMVIAATAFSLPVFLLAMVFSYIPGVKEGLNTNVGGFTVNEIVQWILTTPVQVRLTDSFPFVFKTARFLLHTKRRWQVR